MPSVLFPSNLKAWKWRKRITISGSTGAGTNYQVLLKVGESSGATGYNFHLEGLSAKFPSRKNDGGDLRFADATGLTLLDFWVESVTGTSPNRVAYVWIKVSADLGTNQNIYCYFGNSNATNASNGDNTFLFFDDFDTSTLDPNKWKTYGSPSVSIANSQLTFYSTSNYSSICSKTSYANNTAMRWYSIFGNTTLGYYGQGYGTDSGTAWSYNIAFEVHWETDPKIEAYPDRVYTGYDTTNRPFRIYEIKRDSAGNATYHINDSQVYADTDLANTTNYDFGTRHWYADGSANSHVFDWVIVRKYVSPEPAFSSAGSLEKRSSIIPLIFIR
jgi:hypothetical protein